MFDAVDYDKTLTGSLEDRTTPGYRFLVTVQFIIFILTASKIDAAV